ncbi:RagB/SusD family nutrient uptake outer membrane protein [Winogradskyella litoriviva]|uniref:RagB/SusD family nutrient uptake outer membrane protein n=1 Tax=Winogradskyella litoriviva TaxID=1220182 RepID=A0ABX2E1E8_9FLAO|nr:RagB/SusD family nutrient uptake outer membrane protein [Winogradskyella litoriviva]NRD22105.1 RagB/SusD family nutrient uptake outer membrane protein [Winogradskyella litoriviva]
MKIRITKPLITIVLFLTVFSCSDDLENESTENNVDPVVVNQLIEDLYAKMYTPGTGGTSGISFRHDDLGHKGYDIYSDLLTGDMALSVGVYNYLPYGWYQDVCKYESTVDFTKIDNQLVWTHYYSIIETANSIIDALGGVDEDLVSDENRHFFGQALAMRAHSYFYLTQFMTNDYNPTAEILPLYTDVSNVNVGKSTTTEVFELIEGDLQNAILLLDGYNRPNKKHVNKIVAQSILAYAIAAQQDVSRMDEIVTLCDAVISNSGATIMNSTEVTGGFNDVSIPGWLWGADITDEVGLLYASWWGQMDYYTYGYAAEGEHKGIDQNLYDAIPANDIRKTQFSPEIFLMPTGKFYDSDLLVGGGVEGIIPFIKADYIYMRIAELHLLKAESLAKIGQDVAARTALSEVLSQRIPDISYLNGLSGTALQDEIYLQTRIELWGEGKTYLALKRNHRSTGIRGDNHFYLAGQSFTHNDERLTFEIPQIVIANNEFINNQN